MSPTASIVQSPGAVSVKFASSAKVRFNVSPPAPFLILTSFPSASKTMSPTASIVQSPGVAIVKAVSSAIVIVTSSAPAPFCIFTSFPSASKIMSPDTSNSRSPEIVFVFTSVWSCLTIAPDPPPSAYIIAPALLATSTARPESEPFQTP